MYILRSYYTKSSSYNIMIMTNLYMVMVTVCRFCQLILESGWGCLIVNCARLEPSYHSKEHRDFLVGSSSNSTYVCMHICIYFYIQYIWLMLFQHIQGLKSIFILKPTLNGWWILMRKHVKNNQETLIFSRKHRFCNQGRSIWTHWFRVFI